ncbi:hypothetical protein D9611_011284 [Ephemerocybe angulata]|uniref:NACHT domain-containing protein n=1 Tax=Ephemerocybe angulata TaxID=980116 RepID=A0A8H5F1L3_9AGAR|nr:hypothetical protein D9611_011284 [Tulosesus angulatus]
MAPTTAQEPKRHRGAGAWLKDKWNRFKPSLSRTTSLQQPPSEGGLVASISQQDLTQGFPNKPLRKRTASLSGLDGACESHRQSGDCNASSPAKTSANGRNDNGGPEPRGPAGVPTQPSPMKVALNFTGTLLKRLPDIVDENPVKMALGLAKTIVQITEAVKDNMDTVDRRIASTFAQLTIVVNALDDPTTYDEKKNSWFREFKSTLEGEFTKLSQLSEEWLARKILDHEDEKKRIAEIFERVNEARIQFQLGTGIAVYKAVDAIQGDLKLLLLDRLKASRRADHKYHLGAKDRETLIRAVCTPGTRVDILSGAVSWANDLSSESPSVYWIFGPAGSGKTTIAFTVARRFELTGDECDTITLGGNFFCSRLFSETRTVTQIVPTIVYHLALRCAAFAETLRESGSFGVIDQDPVTQLRELLVVPWCKSRSKADFGTSNPKHFLIVVDALDEIEGKDGSEFLRALLDVIRENKLPNLKFFITSRSDPDLVARVERFEQKKWCRLQDVEQEIVRGDIAKYLYTNFPHLKDSGEMARLLEFSGGLFICAVTLARYLVVLSRHEQKQALASLFLGSSNSQKKTPSATRLLDVLYSQILTEAFEGFDTEFRINRLRVLHTFLSTPERTSTTTVASLLFPKDPTDDNTPGFPSSTVELVDDVLSRLYAVLYTDETQLVISYHKSFTDFVFDQDRSKEFCCSQAALHESLSEGCFRIMKAGLRFNIANIPSSFLLDWENTGLSEQVNRNITDDLAYSCRQWGFHLSVATPATESESLVLMLSEFLQLHALFWIEAMNLLGCVGVCDPALRSARGWAAPKDTDLARRCGEAASFTLYFSGSPASSSTPHLYVSALATWHPKGDICERWRSYFPKIPTLTTRGARAGSMLMEIDVGSRVIAVAVSGDGRVIASGADDGLVRLWDASTGKAMSVLEGHKDWVRSVAFSRDGTRIVSGSDDKTVRVWDASTGMVLKVLEGHRQRVYSIAICRDGTRILSGSEDKTVRVWDASTGEVLSVLEGHTKSVTSIALSQDGTRIVSASLDKTVRVWDASTGMAMSVLEGHTGPVTSVAFSRDATRIVSASWDKTVRVWDASTGMAMSLLEGHSDWVTSVAFSRDGTRIVSGSFDETVRVWDASTGTVTSVLEGHSDGVTSVAFSRDATRIVSASWDKTVRVWDASTGVVMSVLQGHTGLVHSVAFSRDGTRIVSGSFDETVRVWDASTGTVTSVLEGHSDGVTSVAFSQDETRIVSGSGDKTVRVWDASTGMARSVLEGHINGVRSVALSRDGTRIVSGSQDETVRVWDASTGMAMSVLYGHTETVTSVAFCGDGLRIVSGSDDNTVRVWDASAGIALSILEGHRNSVISVAFSRDGTRIVSGSHDNTVRVWDALTGMVLSALDFKSMDRDVITSVAYSQDGTRLVSGSALGKMRVWDTSTGMALNILQDHSPWVHSVAISRDGTRIVSGSDDNTVSVWNAATGMALGILKGHSDCVNSVAFSRDGTRIVSGSADKTVRVWDLHPIYVHETAPHSLGAGSRTGWLLSGNCRLMFVPSSVNLPEPPCTLLISAETPSSTVHLRHATLGTEWSQCYSPPS